MCGCKVTVVCELVTVPNKTWLNKPAVPNSTSCKMKEIILGANATWVDDSVVYLVPESTGVSDIYKNGILNVMRTSPVAAVLYNQNYMVRTNKQLGMVKYASRTGKV